ncbi:glycoside hydrolase family protein [Pseudomonas psychrotolerans L19]|uniref:cellulase family glycosylhydrolase n=1 Tax=Pseudomonas oryzihabitans TaxID=47885 RepID=UPI00023A259A|nr:cellulase family glycosylhydrolase [Pseudomonas psychrotolerans]EHK72312.1 glycoside hydrolase family protein [Pseudomonas psychrotolerans L19]
MTATLKELGDTLSTAQKQLAELVAAENPTPTPIPDKPVGSLPLDTTIRGAYDKTLILPYSSLILAGQVVIQLATGQAVNVISIGRRDNGDLTAVIDQSIGDPSKVIGKAATVRDRYAKPEASPKPEPVTEVPVVTLPVTAPDPVTVPGVAVLKNIPYLGINLAAHSNANQVLPGEAGTHFKWPSRADVTLYVKTLGVRLIRFPYALQRATLIDSTGLPVKGGQLDPTFVAKLKQVLGWIREDSNGEALVIFDPHHYWRMYRNQTMLVDGARKQTGFLLPANEAAGQGNRWRRQEQVLIADENGWGAADLGVHIASMAKTFDEPMILGYGAGNEPYADGMSVSAMEAKVVADLNVMLPIIRKVTNKPVFVCGNQWASARNFAQVSGTFAAGIKDPANNWIPEVHGYGDLDGGSSGRYSNGNLNAFPVDQIANVFRPAYSYMATKGLRCFVGETGIPPTESARQALARALDEAKANGVPVTLWIAGGDGAMGGEKMNLDDTGHAATRELIKVRAGERMAEWKPVRA